MNLFSARFLNSFIYFFKLSSHFVCKFWWIFTCFSIFQLYVKILIHYCNCANKLDRFAIKTLCGEWSQCLYVCVSKMRVILIGIGLSIWSQLIKHCLKVAFLSYSQHQQNGFMLHIIYCQFAKSPKVRTK